MDYSLPRSLVAVRVRLTAGDPLTGGVFVMDRVPHRDGPETVLEMLNRPEPFFPFRPAAGPSVLLLSKSHTVAVALAAVGPPGDPDRLEASQAVRLTAELANGETVEGEARIEAPVTRQRPLDYLNASSDPFFALVAGDTTWYINRAHVRLARPGD